MLNCAVKQKWTTALRSGEYMQVTGTFGFGHTRCAVGVLLDLTGWNMMTVQEELPVEILNTVLTMNDITLKSFPQIADYIEENLHCDSPAQRLYEAAKIAVAGQLQEEVG